MAVAPYTEATSTSTGSTSYYMGGKGIGSGSNDYAQFVMPTTGYANMVLAFRLRASNTGAGSFQMQYSTDGVDFKTFPQEPMLISTRNTWAVSRRK